MSEDRDSPSPPPARKIAGPSKRNLGAASSSSAASGPDYNVLSMMDEICDKLTILNYQAEFVKQREFPVLERTYFAMAASGPSAAAQFPYFSSLVLWLLGLLRHKVNMEWGEYDDPNSVSNTILVELKKLGFDGDFPAAKLKPGFGDAVCTVLLFLINKVLTAEKYVAPASVSSLSSCIAGCPQYFRGDPPESYSVLCSVVLLCCDCVVLRCDAA